MRAVIYAAKSTTDVHDSLPGQIRDCEALASREGLEVAERWTDEAESAYHGDRGAGLESAMRDCERLTPCALIVQHTSRLARGDARQSRHLVEIAIWAIQHGVEIKSVENPLPADNLLLLAAVAGDQDHAYSKRLGTSVSGGLARSFKRGNWPGKPSDGYLVEIERDSGGRTLRRGLVKDPEMQETIDRLLSLATDHRLPPAVIARQLNGAGMTNKRGSPWRSRDVKRALLNPMYAGILRYKGEERRDACPAYIRVDQHELLLAHYDVTTPLSQGPRRKGRRSDGFVLRGLAVCGRCGQPMDCFTRTDYEDGVPRRQYRCRSFAVQGDCRARLDAADVDAEVVRYLDELISDFDTWRTEVLDAASSERDEAQRALDSALADLDRLDTRAGKIEADYLRAIDAGREAAAETLMRLVERNAEQRRQAVEQVDVRGAALALLETGAVDERMAETRRRLSDRDVSAINDALHVEFESLAIDPDTGAMTPTWKPPTTEFDFGTWLSLASKYTEPC